MSLNNYKDIRVCINDLDRLISNKKIMNSDVISKSKFLIQKRDYDKKQLILKSEKLKDVILKLKDENKGVSNTLYQLYLSFDKEIEKENYKNGSIVLKKMADVIATIIDDEKLEKGQEVKNFTFKIPKKIPLAIRDEILLDINEIKKCYEKECYRSCIIICGRVLEVCLHRKYYEITNNDILETNPGIGLGKLIAKLYELGVKFGPGVNEQIHLINQTRIHSVHIKNETFIPTKNQTEAIILYTLDIIEKLFDKI